MFCGSSGRHQYATRMSTLTLYAEAKALAKALEDEKSKGRTRKRYLEDGQGVQTSDSTPASAFNTKVAKPERTFAFARDKVGRRQVVGRRYRSEAEDTEIKFIKEASNDKIDA